MRTYEKFLSPLIEATEQDLKNMGASPEQIKMLKKRQASRGKGFSTGDDRVNKIKSDSPQRSLPPAKSTAITRSSPSSSRTGKEAVGAPRKSGPGVLKGGSLAKRPADKGAAIVRHRNELKKDAKQKLSSGSAGRPKLSPRKPSNPTKKSVGSKDPKGFMGGLKSSLGGDAFSKDKKERLAAREKTGRSLGNAIKSAPGKALRTATNAAQKTVSGGPGQARFDGGEKSKTTEWSAGK